MATPLGFTIYKRDINTNFLGACDASSNDKRGICRRSASTIVLTRIGKVYFCCEHDDDQQVADFIAELCALRSSEPSK